jgi:hypothetical protein
MQAERGERNRDDYLVDTWKRREGARLYNSLQPRYVPTTKPKLWSRDPGGDRSGAYESGTLYMHDNLSISSDDKNCPQFQGPLTYIVQTAKSSVLPPLGKSTMGFLETALTVVCAPPNDSSPFPLVGHVCSCCLRATSRQPLAIGYLAMTMLQQLPPTSRDFCATLQSSAEPLDVQHQLS